MGNRKQFQAKRVFLLSLPIKHTNKQTKTPGLQSASEIYRPSDRRLSAKLVVV
jgi:hypothetical protein